MKILIFIAAFFASSVSFGKLTCSELFLLTKPGPKLHQYVWVSMSRDISISFLNELDEEVLSNEAIIDVDKKLVDDIAITGPIKSSRMTFDLKGLKLSRTQEFNWVFFYHLKVIYENKDYELSIMRTSYSIERIILRKKYRLGSRRTILDIHDTIFPSLVKEGYFF